MVTIKEIAKQCNVSIATVSNILNNKPGASDATRKLIMDKAKELNFMPNYVAKNLKMKNTRTIGVVAEDLTIFSIPDIVDGITEYCEEQDYQILLANLRLFKKYKDTFYSSDEHFEQVKQELKILLAKQVEGIIYISAHERVISYIPENFPIPVLVAYGYTRSDSIPSVVVNDEQGAYDVVSHLILNGHKSIGVICGKSDSMHVQARLYGYQKALFEHGILFDPRAIVYGDWTREGGYERTDEILDSGVTAIFCMNDLMAGGVYDRLLERGLKVGEDISLVGFDNRELSSYYKPALTTIDIPLHDIGYTSGQIMIEMVEKKGTFKIKPVTEIDCQVLIRDSIKNITTNE